MKQYRYKSHIGHVPIVLYLRSTNRSHQVTSEETKFCLRVSCSQSRHQMRGMQVT